MGGTIIISPEVSWRSNSFTFDFVTNHVLAEFSPGDTLAPVFIGTGWGFVDLEKVGEIDYSRLLLYVQRAFVKGLNTMVSTYVDSIDDEVRRLRCARLSKFSLLKAMLNSDPRNGQKGYRTVLYSTDSVQITADAWLTQCALEHLVCYAPYANPDVRLTRLLDHGLDGLDTLSLEELEASIHGAYQANVDYRIYASKGVERLPVIEAEVTTAISALHLKLVDIRYQRRRDQKS